jgi:hypothetical protein
MPKPFVHSQVAAMPIEQFTALVEQILNGLPDELAEEWFTALGEQDAEPDQPHGLMLPAKWWDASTPDPPMYEAFWDAASRVIQHLLLRGVLVLPPAQAQPTEKEVT